MESLFHPAETMGRRLRWLPAKATLVAVAWRVVQGRFLLRPSPELNDIVLGILGRAQGRHSIRVCALAVMSNHLHLLMVADDAEQVADFMQEVGSRLAREVNRLTGWSGPVFQGRYSMIVVTEEEAAQVERLKYVLAQGCKENLVERLRDWPGVHSVTAHLGGTPMIGHRVGRARAGGGEVEVLHLSALPCWRHLPRDVYRRRIADLVDEIETEAAAERARAGTRALGVRKILAQHPHHRPATIARSLAPLVHAATRAARQVFREAYRRFVAAFRVAAAGVRRGNPAAVFPSGSFPPAPPFVSG